jgi:hypothetical protein
MPDEMVRYIEKLGDTEEQAEGLLAGGVPRFTGDRLQLYMNWCGMHERDPRYPESIFAFMHEDLVGAALEIGDDVRRAKTAEDAAQALAPYRERFCDGA